MVKLSLEMFFYYLNNRRKLLRITDENKLVTVKERTEGGEKQGLTCLVENAIVESSSGDCRMVDAETGRSDDWSTLEHCFE